MGVLSSPGEFNRPRVREHEISHRRAPTPTGSRASPPRRARPRKEIPFC